MSKLFHTFVAFAALVLVLGVSTSVKAAEFASDQNVSITTQQENLYASGTSVSINTNIKKDLIVAGQTVDIQGSVERNLIAAGQIVNIKTSTVGASVRAAGQFVTLDGGTYSEDLVLAGQTVTIKNATVNGDLVVGASQLILENSKIAGDARVSYEQINGDLDAQVNGQLYVDQGNENSKVTEDIQKSTENSSNAFGQLYGSQFFISGVIGSASALLVISFWLNRRNRLEIPSLKFNGQFFLNWIIGLGIAVLSVIVLLISVFLNLIPFLGALSITGLVGVISLAILVLFQLGALFAPVYLANMLKGSFKIKLAILPLTWVTYLVLILLDLLASFAPGFGVITFLIWLFLGPASFVYITRKLFASIKYYLSER